MEKAGKPAVGIVAAGFEGAARATAKAFGLPEFRFARVGRVLTGIPPEEIEDEVAAAIEQIVAGLIEAGIDVAATARALEPTDVLRYEAEDAWSAAERMNEDFLQRDWGDGFPLIPPTPEKVRRMLAGTTRAATDVVTIMAPGSGIATVEKIAINAVMAGCEPVHLPILIAICEAYTGMGERVRAMAMSTSAHAPLIVINGPIVKELGINAGQCALGPGKQSRHNIVLGRALRLMMINLGNCRPGQMDMDTIGSARKFGMVVGENEGESPWDAFHVEHGFAQGESTVTIFGTRTEIDVNDLDNWTPEGVLNSFAFYGAIPGGEYLAKIHNGETSDYIHLLVMCPEHAQLLGKAGWSKKSVRDYVYQHCRISAKRLMNKCRNTPDIVRTEWRWLLEMSERERDQVIMPCMEKADDIKIVVVGGPAGKNMIYHTITKPSTVVIRDRA